MVILVFEEQEYSRPCLDALVSGLAQARRRRSPCRRPGGAHVVDSSGIHHGRPGCPGRLAARRVRRPTQPRVERGDVEHALAVSRPAHAVGDHPVLAELMPMHHLDEPIEPAVSAEPAPS